MSAKKYCKMWLATADDIEDVLLREKVIQVSISLNLDPTAIFANNSGTDSPTRRRSSSCS